ncbi:alcohol dehydrogenase [compost metagenome]
MLKGITIRGSIVGTRSDLQESLDFAAHGDVKATVSTAKLDDINNVLGRLRDGKVEGRVVLDFNA